jgi:hypothetical protein
MATYTNTNARQATRMWTLAQPTVSAYVASVVRDNAERTTCSRRSLSRSLNRLIGMTLTVRLWDGL